MKLQRRHFLKLATGLAAIPATRRSSWAQSYPSRPIRLVVGFPAGQGIDILARLIAQSLSERLGQPFVVENRVGAGGNIGTEAVVRAPPDGYTLLVVTASNASNATLYHNLNFNFIRDIAPVASLARSANIMVVSPTLPVKTVPEFIAYAKANPGKLNLASGGTATGSHLAGELFKSMTGIDIVHVPYRGVPVAHTALLTGEAHVMFDTLASSIEHVKAGTLRALGVTSATSLDVAPEIPAVGDFVAGYEASIFSGIGAPVNTPAEIVSKLNGELNATLAAPNIRARMSALGFTAAPSSPAEFSQHIGAETEKWAKVIKSANIKAE